MHAILFHEAGFVCVCCPIIVFGVLALLVLLVIDKRLIGYRDKVLLTTSRRMFPVKDDKLSLPDRDVIRKKTINKSQTGRREQ